MTTRVYGAGASIVEKVLAYFSRQDETHTWGLRLGGRVSEVAVAPRREDLELMINAAFWASLHSHEGRQVRISMAYLAPEQSGQPFRFRQPLAVVADDLVKVAPAVERPHIHLGIWPDASGAARIWGTTRSVPMLGFVLEVAGPGLLVIKHRRGSRYSKFVNVAVLAGDEAKFVSEQAGESVDCGDVLHPLFARDRTRPGVGLLDPTSIFVKLAVSMRDHGRGGTLLVVPAGRATWRESVTEPFPYEGAELFAELRELARDARTAQARRKRKDSLGRAVDMVAGLTAVDGAAIVTDELDLIGFGAKIVRRSGHPTVERVFVSEPVEGNVGVVEAPSVLGGTRHLSAAQFVQDQHDAIALVASQDGRFTIFSWLECDDIVHAQRIDALLL
jgi:hypothetical protein